MLINRFVGISGGVCYFGLKRKESVPHRRVNIYLVGNRDLSIMGADVVTTSARADAAAS